MTVGPAVVRLSFPARAEYLILARLALAGVGRAVAMEEEVLADLKLAVTEACGNVVRHAYASRDGEEGAVRVTIDASGGIVAITVEDDGVGVPDIQGNPAADGRPDGEGGMGLAIIGAIADELEVRRAGPDGGTVLLLRKSL